MGALLQFCWGPWLGKRLFHVLLTFANEHLDLSINENMVAHFVLGPARDPYLARSL